MAKDMFGHSHPPSACCNKAIIRSSGPGFDRPVCSGCNNPVRHKDRMEKAWLETSDKLRLLAREFGFEDDMGDKLCDDVTAIIKKRTGVSVRDL